MHMRLASGMGPRVQSVHNRWPTVAVLDADSQSALTLPQLSTGNRFDDNATEITPAAAHSWLPSPP